MWSPDLTRWGFVTQSHHMTDIVDKARRSQVMSAIRSKNTRPELAVRRLLYGMGFRYRLHADDLPGKPDIVLRRKNKAILIHGCFWHRHAGCPKASMPKTRPDFWRHKFAANVARDKAVLQALTEQGWSVLTVWQCEIRNAEQLKARLNDFLGD
jgi:DNA mismatch endonuclease (patch repair protein)